MQILAPRNHYKPFDMPWAYKLWQDHEALHWTAREVPMQEDVGDWNGKLTDAEKSLLTHVFRFFTQADISVAEGYNKLFLPYFAHKPELAMMMSSFAAREAVHIDAYALLLETVGMPETTYSQFQEYKEMKDKHEYLHGFSTESVYDTLKSLAVYSAFTEGMQLFGSFVVLLNFARFNKMKNMGNIIAWSIRDESIHVDGMTRLFKEMFNQWFDTYETDTDPKKKAFVSSLGNAQKTKLIFDIKEIAYKMVALEDAFIDLIFKDGAMEGLTKEEVKLYIRFIAQKRWAQLGFQGSLYSVPKNPLPWVDHMVNGEEHSNFFESKPTNYTKGATTGTMGDIKWNG